jgi:glycosyl transferase family 25
MNHIDAILYINLAHRLDRNEHILKEIHKLCEDDSKIHRIDAIKKEPGILGCGYSHIKALEYALEHPEWNTILILEDDFTFKSDFPVEVQTSIDLFLTYCDNYDVALLAFNHNKIKYNDTKFTFMKRVNYSQTASSYIIKKNYIPILINNMREGVNDMVKNGKNHHNAVDIYWTKLMPLGKWYCIFPAIGYQYENYSDIEKKYTNYKC